MPAIDVLIPTCRRPMALAVTLTSLCAQTFRDFRLVISDQTEGQDTTAHQELQAVLRVLRLHGHAVDLHTHLPNRGMAEHRQFLLDQAVAPYALFLDDDLILEPGVIGRMYSAICEEGCGLVGSALIGLSYVNDVRPQQQNVEFWEGPVRPERIVPDSPSWQRYQLHNAANVYHLQRRLELGDTMPGGTSAVRKYRVAWVGGCVMYDTKKLRDVGGFHFWRELPANHCGEDVVAQLRVLARYGGCGLLPSGVYHQELPTTIEDRRVNGPRIVDLFE